MMIPDDVWAALALHERELSPDSPRLADTRALVAINDRAVSQSDIVFAESRQVVDHAVANGGDPARMVVLGQGIDVSAFVPAPKPPGARPLRVLSISQVRAQKGVIYTGEAAQLAAASVERFTVVGRTLPDGRREADRLSRMPNVSLLGEVSPLEVRRHLAEADVLVLATLADSMPRAVMEGLASGLPVIVTPESGYADTVIDGVHGFIVPSRDPAAIAAKLELLSADPDLRQRMGAAARELAVQFSWDRIGERFLDEVTQRLPALGRGQPAERVR
jgi:glycosyltransferase involved in cell wall biosynthesis